ncbi:Luc7p KNAG_0A05790 [Huiozyma naganishii CBS 8797]|uniref:Uncharacterized protein n=1 Tax=Huiozyma naganishii (strain ATCC MYA-139 / BCRC 22969 / CBS 8797 / KCTC 17520 / NBRC 10181 / NCYC 3082 / Yp74L-3) TaxID=1071383 RepID=J7RTY0_HUIN7|nr:hypothetical protein KNAG_0A05790 [Kazachstania naganishii CBS 8797]CCK68242.1 hypothetical protein KNAG_0A05790 [Kazachstania naganishii CBS 8797]
MGIYDAEQRKLIDQLVGKDFLRFSGNHRHSRAAHVHISGPKKDFGLSDARVCKAYLVGSCPYDLFQNSKQSMGKCPQIHLLKYKMQYEKMKKQGHDFLNFEREYFTILSKFINDCNGQTRIALKRLEHTPEERAKIQQVTNELDELDTRIGLMMQEIDSLIEHNEVVKAMQQSVKLQEMQDNRKVVAKKIKNITENVGQSAQQKLQVCEVCGAYLSRLDTDRRLADHFLGKVHLGYVKMREDYNIYRKKIIKT